MAPAGVSPRTPEIGRQGTWRLLLVVLIAAFALPGCLGADVEAKVDDDGSGELVVEVFPDSDVMRQTEGLDVAALLGEQAGGPIDLDLTRIDVDGRSGFRLEVPFDDATALGGVVVDGITIAGQQIQLFSAFDLREVDEGRWRLDATVVAGGSVISDAAGSVLTDEEMLEIAGDAAGIGFGGVAVSTRSLKLSIILPGEVISSNADSTSGGRATWTLSGPDAPTSLLMETRPREFPTPAQLVVGGAALALLLGLVLVGFGGVRDRTGTRTSRRRRGRFRGPDRGSGSWQAPGSDPVLPSAAPALPTMATSLVAPAPDPAPAPEPTPPAGWYPDPASTSSRRFWDGACWTDQVR